MTPFVVLLPPSEGKAMGGTGPAWQPEQGRFGAQLAKPRLRVVKALSKRKGGDEALLGVSGRHLERALAVNRALVGAPTMAAAERYTGVVYDHLSVPTLTEPARQRAMEQVIVLSGLLGAVTLGDPLPDYRLKMGASLAPFGRMAGWWRPLLSKMLAEALQGYTVVDLLPLEHRSALALPPSIDRLSIRFEDRTGKPAGHDAKAAKGLFVRHLLTTGTGLEGALASFEHDRFVALVSGP